jgi:hypothetical protein
MNQKNYPFQFITKMRSKSEGIVKISSQNEKTLSGKFAGTKV